MTVSFFLTQIGFLYAIFYAISWYFVVRLTSRGFLNVRNYLSLFLILLPTMVLIISVIKSSLALSLGLVGALSIIRFRTPIKEPIELMYFFVPIALGLSLGAEQYILAFVFFVIVSVALLMVAKFRGGAIHKASSFSIELKMPSKHKVETINMIMSNIFISYDLQRCNVTPDEVVLSYKVASMKSGTQEKLIADINEKAKGTSVSIFNNSHIVA